MRAGTSAASPWMKMGPATRPVGIFWAAHHWQGRGPQSPRQAPHYPPHGITCQIPPAHDLSGASAGCPDHAAWFWRYSRQLGACGLSISGAISSGTAGPACATGDGKREHCDPAHDPERGVPQRTCSAELVSRCGDSSPRLLSTAPISGVLGVTLSFLLSPIRVWASSLGTLEYKGVGDVFLLYFSYLSQTKPGAWGAARPHTPILKAAPAPNHEAKSRGTARVSGRGSELSRAVQERSPAELRHKQVQVPHSPVKGPAAAGFRVSQELQEKLTESLLKALWKALPSTPSNQPITLEIRFQRMTFGRLKHSGYRGSVTHNGDNTKVHPQPSG
ncbi:PREDICTED: uncharacterized protein LOC102014327 [Chinchilla lanigera]|uniref:uncharacterized protein LOC102014327 n=1 Tax=Chinchilla lanigera TaxID=34839 RepID=UPI00038ECF36|nr:PREDICTED: uncharacterized protein LOC102014327 [Chinchilla lanigera]